MGEDIEELEDFMSVGWRRHTSLLLPGSHLTEKYTGKCSLRSKKNGRTIYADSCLVY
jgi:hypothetical protein